MMTDRKIFGIIKNLNKKERAAFSDFLSSPYFNKDIKLVSLFSIILEYIDYKPDEWDDGKCYTRVYNSSAFNQNVYNKLHSKFFQLYERFIAVEFNEQNLVELELSTANYYLLKKDFKSLNTKLDSIDAILNKNVNKEEDYLRYRYKYERLKYDSLILNDPRKGALNIQELIHSFDAYFMMVKLELFIVAETRKKLLNVDFDVILKEELIRLIDTNSNSPISLKVYNTALKLMLDPTNKDFYQLLIIYIDTYSSLFTKKDLLLFFNILESGARKIFIQNQDYFIALFDLYNKMIKNEVVLQNNELNPTKFMNFITVAIKVQEFEWAKSIIEKYQPYLPADLVNDYSNFNLAKIHFAQSNYDLVFDLLSDTQYQNIELKLGVKRLYSKVYFEKNEFHALENYLNTFKIFIHRLDSISKYHLELNNSFISHLHKLLKIASDPDRKGIHKFLDKINAENNLIEKEWILEKINSMLK